MFVADELIEAGARGSQEHNVSRDCRFAGAAHCVVYRAGTDYLRSFYLGLNLLRGRADGVHPLDPLLQHGIEDGIVAALVLAAEDEVNSSGKRFQRLDGRIDVGGLGIVVILNAAHRGYVFQAMLDCLEVRNGTADVSGIDACEHARAYSRQHVLDVMCALQRNLGNVQDGLFAVSVAPDNVVAAQESSVLDLSLTAEPVQGSFSFV